MVLRRRMTVDAAFGNMAAMPLRASAALSVLLLALGTALPSAASAVTEPPRLDQTYVISGTLDVAAGRLDAVEELEITNRSASTIDHVDLSAVPRALGYFTLGDVTVDGEPAAMEWTTGINLRVELDGLRRGESARLRLAFRLDVSRSPDAFAARTSSDNGVLSFGQWFPIVSIEHDAYGIGDPQISFTAEAIRLELTTTTELPVDAVACPGLTEGGTTTWTCESENVRDFSFVVNPRFHLTRRDAGGVDIRVYTETGDGALTADLARHAVIGMSDTFGAYPWPDLVLAEIGSGGGFSMEYPRMIHLTRDKVADPYVVFHEVAHQWFYGQLGNDQQREPWLDEGFADFSARYLMGIGENQCSTRPVNSEVFAWTADATTGGDWTSCDGYFHAVFYRGTEFLNAVRAAMGEDSFYGAIRGWVQRNRFGFATGDRLLGRLQAATDTDLSPIFDAYLADYVVRPPKAASTLQRSG